MRLIVDTDIVINNILGAKRRIASAIDAGIELVMPEAQVLEAFGVLVGKLGTDPGLAQRQINRVTEEIDTVEMSALLALETAARARLHKRGQPDWPVLAAALLLDAHIWTNDRDFFGVGVAVWCDDTIEIAYGQAA